MSSFPFIIHVFDDCDMSELVCSYHVFNQDLLNIFSRNNAEQTNCTFN